MRCHDFVVVDTEEKWKEKNTSDGTISGARRASREREEAKKKRETSLILLSSAQRMKSLSLTFSNFVFRDYCFMFFSLYIFNSHAAWVKADTAPARTFSCASMSPK